MRYIFLFIFIMNVSSCNIKELSVVKKLYDEEKENWHINSLSFRWKNYNYFSDNFNFCHLVEESSEIKDANACELIFKNKQHVVVQSLSFYNDSNLIKSYTEMYRHAEYLRKLKRIDYNRLCYSIWESQFYYVAKLGKNIFLIGSVNAELFSFSDSESSLESNKDNLLESKNVYEYILKNK